MFFFFFLWVLKGYREFCWCFGGLAGHSKLEEVAGLMGSALCSGVSLADLVHGGQSAHTRNP